MPIINKTLNGDQILNDNSTHINDLNTRHVSDTEKSSWNSRMGAVTKAGLPYHGLAYPDGNDGGWIRSCHEGLLPRYSNAFNNSFHGASSLGTEAWTFNNIWGAYGNFTKGLNLTGEKLIIGKATNAGRNNQGKISFESDLTQGVQLRYNSFDDIRPPFGLHIERTPENTQTSNLPYLDVQGSIYTKGNEVYHAGNKPTAATVGALPISGGTMSGSITMNSVLRDKRITTGNTQMLNVGNSNIVYVGNPTTNLTLEGTVLNFNQSAVIAYGSNSNGSYVRFYDGSQICRILKSINVTFSAYGNGLYDADWAWTFPAAFADAGTVSVVCSQFKWGTSASWGAVSDFSTTIANLKGIDCYSRGSSTATKVSAIAVGRWK